jgi:putative redox protein
VRMDVVSVLKKKQQDVTAFEIKVHADQAEEFPKVFTHTVITYLVTGHHVDEAAVVRSIELSATKYCPAQAMLSKVVPMDLVYEIYEDEGDGNTKLVKKGIYQPQTI